MPAVPLLFMVMVVRVIMMAMLSRLSHVLLCFGRRAIDARERELVFPSSSSIYQPMCCVRWRTCNWMQRSNRMDFRAENIIFLSSHVFSILLFLFCRSPRLVKTMTMMTRSTWRRKRYDSFDVWLVSNQRSCRSAQCIVFLFIVTAGRGGCTEKGSWSIAQGQEEVNKSNDREN